MDRERLRRGAQLALVVIAVAAASAAGVRYAMTRIGAAQGERVVADPSSGPVGMRPFLEARGYDEDRTVAVYLCPPGPSPDTEDPGRVDDCVELGSGAAGSRLTATPIPDRFPGGAEIVPGAYPLRAGPDPDGAYPVRGAFTIVPFTIGSVPRGGSFDGVPLDDIEIGELREVARGAPCRTRFMPDGRLALSGLIFDPRTGVTVQLDIQGVELAWAPTRDRLAIVPTDRKEVMLAAPDGSDRTVVVREPRGVISSVTWSPDGAALAYVARTEAGVRGGPGPPTVFVLDVTDGTTRAIGGGESVAWSPDPGRLAVETVGGMIELSDPAGARTGVTEGRRPAWSPDGSLLAFIRPQDGEAGETWIARVGEPETRRLAPAEVCGIAFSPDGRRTAEVMKQADTTVLVVRPIRVPRED